MTTKLLMPKLNSNDEHVKIIEWLAENKQYVPAGEPILRIETSKTNVEVESQYSGYLLRTSQAHDTLEVGQCYAKLFESLDALEHDSEEKAEEIVEADAFSNVSLKSIPIGTIFANISQ